MRAALCVQRFWCLLLLLLHCPGRGRGAPTTYQRQRRWMGSLRMRPWYLLLSACTTRARLRPTALHCHALAWRAATFFVTCCHVWLDLTLPSAGRTRRQGDDWGLPASMRHTQGVSLMRPRRQHVAAGTTRSLLCAARGAPARGNCCGALLAAPSVAQQCLPARLPCRHVRACVRLAASAPWGGVCNGAATPPGRLHSTAFAFTDGAPFVGRRSSLASSLCLQRLFALCARLFCVLLAVAFPPLAPRAPAQHMPVLGAPASWVCACVCLRGQRGL
jgi:hypothetical protein